MTGSYNAPNTDYNKDLVWAKVTPDLETKIHMTEGVAVDGEKAITLFGWFLKITNIEKFGDKMFVYEPQLTRLSIPKSTYNVTYNGKEKTYVQTPGMKVCCDAIAAHGYGNYLKLAVDFGMPVEVSASLTSGLQTDGKALNDASADMLRKFFFDLTPIKEEDLLHLKDVAIPTGNGNGKQYARGQSEKDRLEDRLAFVADQCKENSLLHEILGKDNASQLDLFKQMWLEHLL